MRKGGWGEFLPAAEDGWVSFAPKADEGVSEDSLLIPNLPLEKALEYGRMFDPPQRGILWGQDGKYAFYSVSDGKPKVIRDVVEDFTILQQPEVQKLTEEKADIGFTKVRRDTRTWTTEPKIKEWREKPKTSSYLVVTDPRHTLAMGNFEEVVKGCRLSAARCLEYDDGKYSIPVGMLMVALPFPMEVPE